MPYDVHLISDMFDNLTTSEIVVRGNHPKLGMDIKSTSTTKLPKIYTSGKNTPMEIRVEAELYNANRRNASSDD